MPTASVPPLLIARSVVFVATCLIPPYQEHVAGLMPEPPGTIAAEADMFNLFSRKKL
jgi:hypothetical protein